MAEDRTRLPFQERAGGAQAETRRDTGWFELYKRIGVGIRLENAACGNADRRVFGEAWHTLRRRSLRSDQLAAEFAIGAPGPAHCSPERGQSTATTIDAG